MENFTKEQQEAASKRIRETRKWMKANKHRSIYYGMSSQEVIDFMRGRIRHPKLKVHYNEI